MSISPKKCVDFAWNTRGAASDGQFLLGSEAFVSALGLGAEADGPDGASDDRDVQREVRLSARARQQQGRAEPLQKHARIPVSKPEAPAPPSTSRVEQRPA